ncbi:MAG: DUF1573 domain-containing protein [Bacteroidetes bacterium]|nr:MAG: DUF1573 domain-containing protein [Bacteroidota bacterium]
MNSIPKLPVVPVMENSVKQKVLIICRNIALLILGVSLVFATRFYINYQQKPPLTSVFSLTPVINLGQIKLGQPVEAHFLLVNKGPHPLVVFDYEADCSCSVASISSPETAPGDTLHIKFQFLENHLPGFFQRSLILNLNTASSPIVLVMRGKLIGTPSQ